MRDFTHILETEVLTTIRDSNQSFGDIQRSGRQVLESLSNLQIRLNTTEEQTEKRCKESVTEHEYRIRQLEDDIASMISKMKEQDRHT